MLLCGHFTSIQKSKSQFKESRPLIEKTQGPSTGQLAGLLALQSPVQEELVQVQEELTRFFKCDVDLINQISEHMLKSPGKRLRPTLLLLSAKLQGEADRRAVLCGAIIELIHTATLIHDDSIDRSFTRRGLPTVHSLWNDQISVIMGDYLYSKAFYLMVDNGLADVMPLFAAATHRMCLGEMLELEKKLDFGMREEDYNRLILEKTAVLISAACEVGAHLTWGEGRERQLLADFGTNLGMAFQIMDDILDIEGDPADMGKATGSDFQDGKITLPLIYALAKAPNPQQEAIKKQLVACENDESALRRVLEFTHEFGGVAYARNRARGYADRALELLDAFEDNPVRATLHDSVEYVLDRRR